MSYLNARSGSITHSSFQSGYMSKSSVQPGYITHSSTRRRYLSHWSAQPGYMKDSSAQLGYISNWRFLLESAVCNTRLKGKVLYKFIVGVYLPTVLVRNLTFQCTVWKKTTRNWSTSSNWNVRNLSKVDPRLKLSLWYEI